MGTVTFEFDQTTIPNTNLRISLKGGTFGLNANSPIQIQGDVTFSSLSVGTNRINLGVQAGASFNAQITLPVTASGTGDPSVEVDNFTGTATVTWPSADGQMNATLNSGNATYLEQFQS